MKLTNQKIVDLKIRGLTIPEAKEILEKVREVEQRNPERLFLIQLASLERNVRGVRDILGDIFPDREISNREMLSDVSPRFMAISRKKVKK